MVLALTVPWDQAALVVVEEKAILGLVLVGDLARPDKVIRALQVMEVHEVVAVVVLAVQAAVQMAAPANVLLGRYFAGGGGGHSTGSGGIGGGGSWPGGGGGNNTGGGAGGLDPTSGSVTGGPGIVILRFAQ